MYFSHSLRIVTNNGASYNMEEICISFVASYMLFDSYWLQDMLSVARIIVSYILCKIYVVYA